MPNQFLAHCQIQKFGWLMLVNCCQSKTGLYMRSKTTDQGQIIPSGVIVPSLIAIKAINKLKKTMGHHFKDVVRYLPSKKGRSPTRSRRIQQKCQSSTSSPDGSHLCKTSSFRGNPATLGGADSSWTWPRSPRSPAMATARLVTQNF